MPEIYLKCNRVSTYPRAIYYYCEHEGSIIHTKFSQKQLDDRLKLYQHLEEIYEKEKLYKKQGEVMYRYIEQYCKNKKDSRYSVTKEQKDRYRLKIIAYILTPKVASIRNRVRMLKMIVTNL